MKANNRKMADSKQYTQFQNETEPTNELSQYPPQYPGGGQQMAAQYPGGGQQMAAQYPGGGQQMAAQYPGGGQQMAPQVMVQQVPPVSTVVVDTTHTVVIRWSWCNLVTAFISMFFCCLFGMIATVSAVLAYVDHKAKDFERSRGKRNVAWGFGIAAIVIGCITLIVVIITTVLAAQRAVETIHGLNNNGY